MKILVDENFPRSTTKSLIKAGYDARDMRDYGMRGSSDDEVFRFAQDEGLIILTRDKGFGNIWRFPLGQHYGIIIVRFPNEMSIERVNSSVITNLHTLSTTDIQGNVVVIELEKIRIRKV